MRLKVAATGAWREDPGARLSWSGAGAECLAPSRCSPGDSPSSGELSAVLGAGVGSVQVTKASLQSSCWDSKDLMAKVNV